MKKKKTLQSLLFEQQVLAILIFTVLVLFMWIGASIYFSYSKSTLEVNETYPTEPLNPRIDVSSLDKIQSRKWFSSADLTSFTPSVKLDEKTATPIPTVRPTALPVNASGSATPRPTLAPSPNATSSGSL